MIARAMAKYIRIAPKKAMIVADTVRGKSVEESLMTLSSINKKASDLLSEVIASAARNAKRKYPDQKYTDVDLYLSKVTVNEGPALARYRAASMGRAMTIRKRTSHILVEIDAIPERIKEKETHEKKETKIKKAMSFGRRLVAKKEK